MSENLDYYLLPHDPVEGLNILREAAGLVSEPRVTIRPVIGRSLLLGWFLAQPTKR